MSRHSQDIKQRQSVAKSSLTTSSSRENIKPKAGEVKPGRFPPADVKPRQFPPADVRPRQFPPPDVRRRDLPTGTKRKPAIGSKRK